ncbi:hypothetical protein QBC45DRAFT_392075 [Copromyces sp. CBS 386.78]|nr:hypothetical protein QBC45DRAFT_392075 [Copromyces sp. CBS 386.78]
MLHLQSEGTRQPPLTTKGHNPKIADAVRKHGSANYDEATGELRKPDGSLVEVLVKPIKPTVSDVVGPDLTEHAKVKRVRRQRQAQPSANNNTPVNNLNPANNINPLNSVLAPVYENQQHHGGYETQMPAPGHGLGGEMGTGTGAQDPRAIDDFNSPVPRGQVFEQSIADPVYHHQNHGGYDFQHPAPGHMFGEELVSGAQDPGAVDGFYCPVPNNQIHNQQLVAVPGHQHQHPGKYEVQNLAPGHGLGGEMGAGAQEPGAIHVGDSVLHSPVA